MVNLLRVRDLLSDLADHSDWRFAIGVRVRFANPTLLYQTYPAEWVKLYNDQAMVFADPTVRWGLEHHGTCRWSDLTHLDETGVLAKAADLGLRYGIVVSVGDDTARTLAFFCLADRELSDAETAFAAARVQDIHDLTENVASLGETELSELRSLNVGLRRRACPPSFS